VGLIALALGLNRLSKQRRPRTIAEEAGVEATFAKVTNLDEIMAYPIVNTPGLVINEQVKSAGRLPRKQEIIAWLKEV